MLRETLSALVLRGHGNATQRAVAKTLGVSLAQVQRWLADGGHAMALGDVMALGPTLGPEILRAAIELIELRPVPAPICPEMIALRALSHCGRLGDTVRRILEDGVVTREEWGAVDRDLAEMIAYLERARAAVRAQTRAPDSAAGGSR